MATKKTKKRNELKGGFTAVYHPMRRSRAWAELKGTGAKLLVELMSKVENHDKVERYKIPFSYTYKEAESRGITRPTFNENVKQLIALGFIDIVERGGVPKRRTMYKLSTRWKDYGTHQFIERHVGHCTSIHGE